MILAVILLLGAATSARAQSLADYDYTNLSFRGLAVSWGYVWPTKVRATPFYDFSLDLGYLGPGVRLSPSITYWSSSMKQSELNRLANQLNRLPALQQRGVTIAGSELGPVRWSDVGINVDADFVWRAPLGVYTYLGATLGVHALNGSGAAINNTFVQDLLDSLVPAVGVSGGLELAPSPGIHVFGEARYMLLTDVRYPGLRVGVRFLLPPRGTGATTGSNGTTR